MRTLRQRFGRNDMKGGKPSAVRGYESRYQNATALQPRHVIGEKPVRNVRIAIKLAQVELGNIGDGRRGHQRDGASA